MNKKNKQLEEEIARFIEEHTSIAKAEFDMGLITSSYEIKGVPMKELEEYSKSLAERGVKASKMPKRCHEEIMLAGLVIANSKMKPEDKIKEIDKFLPYIDNWATCDGVVVRLTGLESQKEYFVQLLKSSRPFYIRVGIVYFMKFFLKKDIRGTVNLLNDNVHNTNYYVEMALAWCYAEALIHDYEYMIEWTQKLARTVVRNRTLQKACESSRVSKERKKEVRALRSRLLGMEI